MIGGCAALSLGKGFEVASQGHDLPGERHDPDLFERGIHADDRHLFHARVGDGPLVRGGRLVVDLGDLGTHPGLFHQLLLGQQVVGEVAVQFPDLVEQLQLGRGVIAQVSDQLADPGPVLRTPRGRRRSCSRIRNG